MICLGIDTALGACSVALIDGQAMLGHAFEPMTTGHAEALAPMTDRVMREAGRAFRDIQTIAVTTGPGTFTGQRIGLAFARGLAVALTVPCVGVTTLEAIAAQARAILPGRPCLIACDAKRGEAYVQSFAASGLALSAPSLVALGGAAAMGAALGPHAVFAGTAAPGIAGGGEIVAVVQPDAQWVARLSLGRSPEVCPPEPLYLRAPDARPPGPLKALPAARVRPA